MLYYEITTSPAIQFDPIFLPENCEIIECSDDGRFLTVERKCDGKIFKRHPGDVKGYYGVHDTVGEENVLSDEAFETREWHKWFEQCTSKAYDSYENEDQDVKDNQKGNRMEHWEVGEANACPEPDITRRSQRLRRPNPKYRDYEVYCSS